MFKRVALAVCLLSLTNGAYQGPLAGGQPAARYPAGLDPRSCPNFPICTNPGVSNAQASQQHQSLATYQAAQSTQLPKPTYQLRYTASPLIQLRKYAQPEYEYVPTFGASRQNIASQSQAASPQYFKPRQHDGRQQYTAPQQPTSPLQYAGPQQFTPQQYTGPQQFTPSQQSVSPRQFTPSQHFASPQKYAPPQQSIKSSIDDQYTPEQKKALDRGEYVGDGDYHGEGLDEALAPGYYQGFPRLVIVYIPTQIKFVKEERGNPTFPTQTKFVKEERGNPILPGYNVNTGKRNKTNYMYIATEHKNLTEHLETEHTDQAIEVETDHGNQKEDIQTKQRNKTEKNKFERRNKIETVQSEHRNQIKEVQNELGKRIELQVEHRNHTEEFEHTFQTEEVQTRIEAAKHDLMEMKPLLCNKNVSLELRTSMVKHYCSATLFHGIENRTLTKDNVRELQSFEEWVQKEIFNISWTEKIHNIQIFDRLGEGLEIKKTVKTKEISCQGYIYHRKGSKHFTIDIAMNDKMQGRVRIAGKRKTSWARKLREMFGCTSIELYMEDKKVKSK